MTFNTKEKELMLKFLKKNYPVHRLKYNMRFKRTIVLENGDVYQLSDKDSVKILYFKLLDVLDIVFATDEEINKDALKTFLHLK